MSTSTIHPARPAAAHGAKEPRGARPLPKGIVGIGQPTRAPSQDSAPPGTLIVGQGIEVKGEIESCKVLRVEGRVEASLRAGALEVLKGGLFTGTAVVDRAEIAGVVDGTLVVREHLSVTATGRAAGRIRYAEIAIAPGGQIVGDVDVGADDEAILRDPEIARAANGA